METNPKTELDITDKVVVLIGSTGLLGTEYVDFLSSRGAKLVIGDVNMDICQNYAERVKETYLTDCLPLEIDLYEESSIRKF